MTAAENSIPQSPAEKPARSLLIGAMFLTIAITPAGWQKTNAAEQTPPSAAANDTESATQREQRPRQILLDVRVVTMKPRDRSKLGTWRKVTLPDDESAVSPAAHTGREVRRKTLKAQILHAPDSASTESLLARMKTVEENGRLHTATNSEIIVRDGDDVLLKPIHDEWFLMLGLQTAHRYFIDGGELEVCMGPAVSMTAHIADSKDITITTTPEVSNRGLIRHLRDPNSEIVTRRSETYSVTLKDGGTVAWVGLVPRDAKDERRSGLSRLALISGLFRNHEAAEREEETVIFVTAQIVPELPPPTTPGRP